MVAVLALAPAIGLGVARFAYGLVLPDMRADLGWSYADAGWMNATNALGYVAGALLSARAISAAGAFRVMFAGVLACIASLLLCGLLRDFVVLNAARILAGLGGAFAFVAGGVLATGIAQRNSERAAFLLGLFYAGPGLGILVSGIGVPLVLDRFGPGSWPAAWVALAALSLALAPGLWLGRGGEATHRGTKRQSAPIDRMAALLGAYLVFGAGYIAYMTFMIAWVRSHGAGAGFQAIFWSVIGLGAMASPWLWAGVLRRGAHGRAFALLTGVTTIGAALPLVSSAPSTLLASAALFGSAFFAVVAATTAFVRRNLPPEGWASGIGALTVGFGIGQTIGPIGVGSLSDGVGGLDGGLWTSAGLLLVAAILGMAQRDFGATS